MHCRWYFIYLKGFAPMPPAPLVWKCGCEVAKWRGVSENCGCQVAKWRWPPEASRGHRRPGGPPGPNSPKCGLLRAFLEPFWEPFWEHFWERFEGPFGAPGGSWWPGSPGASWGSLGDPFTSPFGSPFRGPLGDSFWRLFWFHGVSPYRLGTAVS